MLTLVAKKQMTLLAVAVTCLFLAGSVPALAQQPTGTYSYTMTFDHDGLTTVQIMYTSGFVGSGASWVAIPKTEVADTAVTALKGSITSMARVPYLIGGQAHQFYDNLTFSYAAGSETFSMLARFNMTYGAMIVEPNGFFFSPQIGVPPSATVQASLIFPDGVESLSEAQPAPTQIQRLGSRLALSFNPSSESRIAVTFTVTWPNQTSDLREGIVDVRVPSRYVDLGTRMASLYKRAIPLMNDLFNATMDRISMRFFVPLSLPDFTTGGYTPIDPSTFQTGSIYLNLFYFRSVAGTMETIAVHELTHQYEARAGISPDLLWIHEGLANYVAVRMGKPLDYDVVATNSSLEATASELNGNYGMIQDWRPGDSGTSLYQYYAASYHVFNTLGDEYGGLTMYSKFFRGLHELKDGLRSTNVAVLQLGLAAGADLFPQFTKWGFELADLSIINSRIAKLRAEAELYGPLLPFREEALSHLEQAQSSMYSTPEVAMGHVTIAAFYIETVPMIIGGIILVLILVVAVALVVHRRSRRQADAF